MQLAFHHGLLAHYPPFVERGDVWVMTLDSERASRAVLDAQSPAWRADGRELFYHSVHVTPPAADVPVRMMAVPVRSTGHDLTFGPVQLFEGPYSPTAPTRGYDVTRDGQRFLMSQMDSLLERPVSQVREIVLVQNWTGELATRVRRP